MPAMRADDLALQVPRIGGASAWHSVRVAVVAAGKVVASDCWVARSIRAVTFDVLLTTADLDGTHQRGIVQRLVGRVAP